jgi:hypothetical protein
MITLKEFIVSDEKALEGNKFSNKLTMILDLGNPKLGNMNLISRDITVECDNTQTGEQTDAQREAEMNAYVADLNTL